MNTVESVIQPHLKRMLQSDRIFMLRIVRAENLTDQEKIGFVCDYIAGNSRLMEVSSKAEKLNQSRNN